jgi:hypothetical protein
MSDPSSAASAAPAAGVSPAAPPPIPPTTPVLTAMEYVRLHRRGLRLIMWLTAIALVAILVLWWLKPADNAGSIVKARLILLSIFAGSLGGSLRLAVMPIEDWRRMLDQAGDLSPMALTYAGAVIAGPLIFFAVDSGAMVSAFYGKVIDIKERINETGVCFQAMVGGLFCSHLVKSLEKKLFGAPAPPSPFGPAPSTAPPPLGNAPGPSRPAL